MENVDCRGRSRLDLFMMGDDGTCKPSSTDCWKGTHDSEQVTNILVAEEQQSSQAGFRTILQESNLLQCCLSLNGKHIPTDRNPCALALDALNELYDMCSRWCFMHVRQSSALRNNWVGKKRIENRRCSLLCDALAMMRCEGWYDRPRGGGCATSVIACELENPAGGQELTMGARRTCSGHARRHPHARGVPRGPPSSRWYGRPRHSMTFQVTSAENRR